jgi:hypothetical protein
VLIDKLLDVGAPIEDALADSDVWASDPFCTLALDGPDRAAPIFRILALRQQSVAYVSFCHAHL